jgi:lysophospholipase L1-like esterase
MGLSTNTVIVCDGDSITFNGNPTYPEQLKYQQPSQIFNVAVPGQTLATMLANAPANVDTKLPPNTPGIVVIWGGTNDIGQGTSVSDTYATLVSYCQARRAAGWKVVVVTMLSRTGFDQQHDQYDALIRAGWTGFADSLADVAANSTLGADGASTNTTYFNGGIHPTQLAYDTIIVPIINAALPPYFGGPLPDSMSIFGTPQTQTNGSSSAVTSIAVTMNTASGDLILVAGNGSTTLSVTDTIGNTYTQINQVALSGRNFGLFYCFSSGANASNVVTFHQSVSASAISMFVWDIPLSGGAVLDTQTSFTTTNTAVTITSPAFNTTGIDEIVLAAARPTGTRSATNQVGWTLDAAAFGGSQSGGAQHILFTSAQNSITSSMTWNSTTTGGSAIVVAAFKSSAVIPNSLNWVSGFRKFVNKRG